MPTRTPPAERPSILPRLAAMFLTDGHRIPPEVLETLPPAPDPATWECPAEGTAALGDSRTPDRLRIVPPEY